MNEQKKALRTKAKKLILATDNSARFIFGEKMADILLASPLWKNAKSIFCFYSLPSEPSTLKIINTALKEGKTLILPKCRENGQMSLHPVINLNELKKGAYGIPEPQSNTTVPNENIDLALLPCLAASLDGSRLGKGGGYYDRFLQNFTGVSVVLCPDELLFESGAIPMDRHDIYTQYILTQTKLTKAKK